MILVVLVIIITEFFLHLMAFIFPVYPLHVISSVIEDRTLGHRPNPAYPEHDENGFRNRAVPPVVDLVAMGDSQTYGSGVSSTEAWPQQLAELGNIDVYNLAFGGYSPAHSLLLLDEALSLNPKIVVQGFYAGNDLYESFSLAYYHNQLNSLKTDDSLSIAEIKKLEDAKTLEDEITDVYDYKNKKVHIKLLRYFKNSFVDHSKIVRLFTAAINNFSTSKRKRESWDISTLAKKIALNFPEDCLVFENQDYKTIFTPKYRAATLNLKDPRIFEGFQISLQALHEMKKRLDKRNIQFIVVLIPTKELVFADVVNESNLANTPAKPHYQKLIENETDMRQEAADYFHQNKIAFIDALPFFRKQLYSKEQPYPPSIDGHPNPYGHKAIAQCVYNGL